MVCVDYSTSCIYCMVLDIRCMWACTFPKSFVLFFFIRAMSKWQDTLHPIYFCESAAWMWRLSIQYLALIFEITMIFFLQLKHQSRITGKPQIPQSAVPYCINCWRTDCFLHDVYWAGTKYALLLDRRSKLRGIQTAHSKNLWLLVACRRWHENAGFDIYIHLIPSFCYWLCDLP